jgi:hypothetical protein
MNQPQLLSNSFDDFAAGGSLYPGGSGLITDVHYRLWDYGGTQAPDSVCAVYILFTPTDGSNDGKPVEIFWSVGDATDFQPDHTGGFVSSATKTGIPSSSNWGFISERFKNGCGLDGSVFNQPGVGIRALLNGELTVTRQDQPKREGLERPDDPARKKGNFKPTILVPTRFRGSWERTGAGARPNGPAPVMQMPPQTQPAPSYQPPVQQFAPPPQAPAPVSYQPPPPPPPPGAFTGGAFDIATALRSIVMESGGVVMATEIPKAMLNKIVAAGNVTPADRLGILSAVSAAQLPALAPSLGLRFDGTMLSQ